MKVYVPHIIPATVVVDTDTDEIVQVRVDSTAIQATPTTLNVIEAETCEPVDTGTRLKALRIAALRPMPEYDYGE